MVKANPTSYEEMRQKRIEENKKRMQELNLPQLAQAVHNASLKPSSQGKPRKVGKVTSNVVVRRSSRISAKPAQEYKEVGQFNLGRPRRCCSTHRDLSNRVYADPEAMVDANERAKVLKSKLQNCFTSFVKQMLQSHVTGGFWLGLPSPFCKKHLPDTDVPGFTLIDEDGDKWSTKYLAEKTSLSGGWRGFAIAHKLVHGDALIFELVKRTTFKVTVIPKFPY
ncbi:hypothetical protein AQUCO_02800035v1 [Aquilegia coerulea]|uniref:TF-B3 domain-containing protein n=1 Tax=Aquilegia coerulea TaxID=218851 RepID=A0A2G5D3N5_AQUCA|nr:hypothetical protein AQUCO_02800035v1 [Aquilegia coerulea]